MLNVKVLTAKASIGDPVKNPAGEVLGEIKDILFDRDTMEIEYAVLDYNKGKKEVAIPFSDLTFIGEHGFFMIPLSKKTLDTCSATFSYQGKDYFHTSW